MLPVLTEEPSWAPVLTPDLQSSTTLTIEDLDEAPADVSALFTLCVLAPEPAEALAV
ncbi:hypothetical protein GT045_21155 [Streptomyces sp. SID486]|uniref:hypothetical protein n=1 Tax=unclassified Streptomyces TaxID=2593676 RepID=UPI00136B5517|nr:MULTISPECIES: hypothetical protein [unclassified Streptomyces]MYW17786.1 hypothetical protein [Streptomyces sp. SID2955]MYW48058.1 hypothetical protein [Streptomyces sp. SID161]MYX97258.1 hypothetical protein [Streptomyces sp. SID486]